VGRIAAPTWPFGAAPTLLCQQAITSFTGGKPDQPWELATAQATCGTYSVGPLTRAVAAKSRAPGGSAFSNELTEANLGIFAPRAVLGLGQKLNSRRRDPADGVRGRQRRGD